MWFVLLLCIVAAFADIIGGLLTVIKRLNQREMKIVTGLGTGFLLGATILDRLPNAMEELPTFAPLFIMIGYLLLLLINQFSSHHHLHNYNQLNEKHDSFVNHQSALVTFIGLLFHTFMDGVIIAGAFSLSRSTGILIFFAIAMHKIPEGFSMASISLASGSSRKRALLTASSLALSTLVGAVLTIQMGGINDYVVKILMAVATGTFLYVSTSDLVPALNGKYRGGILSVFIGVAVFYGTLLLITQIGLG